MPKEAKVRRQPTRCAVCERQCAVYHHYNVPSCNGCKHFFRRSILANRSYQCPRILNCNIAISKCRSCRLAKCFRVGMDRQLVQKQEIADENEYMEKELENSPESSTTDSDEYSEGSLVVQKHIPNTGQDALSSVLLNSLLLWERRKAHIRNSRFGIPIEMLYSRQLADFLNHSEVNILTWSEQFEAGPPLPVMATELQELMEGKNLNKHVPSYFLMDLFLTIDLARTLPVYTRLDFEDKRKYISHLSMMIRCLDQNYYDSKRSVDTIVLPNGSTPILMLKSKMARLGTAKTVLGETFNRLKRRVFCCLLKTIKNARLCSEEFVLLRAIFLCNSTVPELSAVGRHMLHSEAERYTQALLHYLQSKMGHFKGAQRFAELLMLAGPISSAAQAEREMFTFTDLMQIGPNKLEIPNYAEKCVLGVGNYK